MNTKKKNFLDSQNQTKKKKKGYPSKKKAGIMVKNYENEIRTWEFGI